MIEPIEPEMQDKALLAIRDMGGHHLTLHKAFGLAGLVMSENNDIRTGVTIRLDRQDRAALIAALIELQEDETVS